MEAIGIGGILLPPLGLVFRDDDPLLRNAFTRKFPLEHFVPMSAVRCRLPDSRAYTWRGEPYEESHLSSNWNMFKEWKRHVEVI